MSSFRVRQAAVLAAVRASCAWHSTGSGKTCMSCVYSVLLARSTTFSIPIDTRSVFFANPFSSCIHFLTAHACWPRVCFYFRSASISPWPMVHVSHSSLHSCCNNVSLILRRHLDGCSCYSTRSPESALHQMTASTPPPRGFGYTAVIKCCNMHHHKRGKREVGAG